MKHDYSLAHLTVLSLTPPQVVDVAARAGYRYVGLRMTRVTPDEVLYDLARDRVRARVRDRRRDAERAGSHRGSLEHHGHLLPGQERASRQYRHGRGGLSAGKEAARP